MTKCMALANAILFTGTAAIAQVTSPPVPVEYTGTTTGLTPRSGITLTFRILKWSTLEDRQRMIPVLTSASQEDKGIPDFTKLLAARPSAGQIWSEGPAGYSLKYAHREELPGGGQRVVVITDRPLGAVDYPGPWRAQGQSGDVPPFTVIELHVSRNGRGEGKMSLTGSFTVDAEAHTVHLSNYDAAPVTIRNVQLKRTARAS
jgi:hypothetical protein